MSEVRLIAESRTEFGKGFARRIRRAGKVPAVLYGHGTDPRHVSLDAREFAHALKGGANTVLTLQLEGGDELALPKSVVRHPLRDYFEHVDLLLVRRGEKVTVEVPLVIVGGDDLKEGIVTTDQQSIALLVEATNIPSEIQIDVAELAVGDQIFAKDLVLPEGAVFPGEPDDLMLSIAAPISEEELEAELAAPGEGDEAAAEEASENADKADEE